MKTLLYSMAAVLSWLGTTTLHAETLAVIGKNQIAVLSDNGAISGITESAAQRSFILALRDSPKNSVYDTTSSIIAPPEWGKTVPRAAGTVQAQTTFAQGFCGHLMLHGLEPNHAYILTFNGTPTTAGNNLLADPVPGLPLERFYDFMRVLTDGSGGYDAKIGVYLLPGEYHVRIYIKDTKDFKIVLYRDYFDFVVTAETGEPLPAH